MMPKIGSYAPAAFFVTVPILILIVISWLLWSRPRDWGAGVFVFGGWLIMVALAAYWHST